MDTKSTTPCSECPFLKGHGWKGYTGPYKDALELHTVAMNHDYPCHTRARCQCVGAQLHRKVNCKGMSDFSQNVQEHQLRCIEDNGTDKAMFLPAFLEHHKPFSEGCKS